MSWRLADLDARAEGVVKQYLREQGGDWIVLDGFEVFLRKDYRPLVEANQEHLHGLLTRVMGDEKYIRFGSARKGNLTYEIKASEHAVAFKKMAEAAGYELREQAMAGGATRFRVPRTRAEAARAVKGSGHHLGD